LSGLFNPVEMELKGDDSALEKGPNGIEVVAGLFTCFDGLIYLAKHERYY